MIETKVEGWIEIERDEERGTRSPCPKCQHRSHPAGRQFGCPKCGWAATGIWWGPGTSLVGMTRMRMLQRGSNRRKEGSPFLAKGGGLKLPTAKAGGFLE